tara:strand:- start:2015 stop:2764 length:750 start_codon:yes stop_codon:yes gene_type:complete
MNLNYLIEDFDNLKKELNIIKKETKDIIKNYSRKIVSLEKDFEKCEYEKIKLKNKLENEIKKLKKKKMIICMECYQEIKISRKNKDKHNCEMKYNSYDWDLDYDGIYNSDNITCVRYNFKKGELCVIQRQLEENKKYKKEYELKLNEINKIQIEIRKKCCKCYKKDKILYTCGCKYDHSYCEDCLDNLDNNCLVCSQMLNLELCPVCISNKKLVNLNCGNNHNMCENCLITLKYYNNYPTCPMCRNELK